MIVKLTLLKNRLRNLSRSAILLLEKHWLKLLAVAFFSFLLLERNLTLEFRLSTSRPYLHMDDTAKAEHAARPTALQTAFHPARGEEGEEELQRQKAYIHRFSDVAKVEMEKFGIPASIKLAQALLESQAGKSPLAVRHNNHFGIKCFSRNCRKGHCSNFQDDSHKDFFRIYGTAWESFRAHSLMLKQNERYQNLFRHSRADYRAWANGLAGAGYATDPDYAQKLIRLIERHGLDRYDEV